MGHLGEEDGLLAAAKAAKAMSAENIIVRRSMEEVGDVSIQKKPEERPSVYIVGKPHSWRAAATW